MLELLLTTLHSNGKIWQSFAKLNFDIIALPCRLGILRYIYH